MYEAGTIYCGFFERQVIGNEAIKDLFFDSVRESTGNVYGRSIGEAVFDDTGVGIVVVASADVINKRRLTFNGALATSTQNGDSFMVGASIPDESYVSGTYTCVTQSHEWFELIPFENRAGSTYHMYIGGTKFPVDVGIGRDGGRGYSAWVDAVGTTINPNSVAVVAGRVILLVDAALTSLDVAHWLTVHVNAAWSMKCMVWLDTDQTGVEIASDNPATAIAYTRLVKDVVTGAWLIDLVGVGDGCLGQTTPSTTATHYKIAMLGPLVTTTVTLQSSPNYVYIGEVTSVVPGESFDFGGQPIVCAYASYAAGYSVEHNAIHGSPDLGRHKSVTAPSEQDLDISVNSVADKTIYFANIGGGGCTVDASLIRTTSIINPGSNIDVSLEDAAAERYFDIRNTGVGHYAIVRVSGEIRAQTTLNGTGIFRADKHFKYDPPGADYEFSHYDPLLMKTMADTWHAAGVGSVGVLYNTGGGAAVNHITVDGIATDGSFFLVPINPPKDFVVTHLRAYHSQEIGATLELGLAFWEEGDVTWTVIDWITFVTKTGSFTSESIALAVPVTLPKDQLRKLYLMVSMINNGVAVDSVKLHKVTVIGKPTYVSPYNG